MMRPRPAQPYARIEPGQWRSICGSIHVGCPVCGCVIDLRQAGVELEDGAALVECEQCDWADEVLVNH